MTDRRDPFVLVEPRNEQANPNGPRPDLRRNREALEEYPLDALRLVGTIKTPAGTFALVKEPDGVVPRGAVKDRKRGGVGTRVSVSVDVGGGGVISIKNCKISNTS